MLKLKIVGECVLADFGVVKFWTYLLGATLIVLVPSPETMLVIKTSISSRIRRGFVAIFSILLSDVILVLLAWCGLAAVISSTPALFNAIEYAGAAYLFYLLRIVHVHIGEFQLIARANVTGKTDA